MSPLRECMCWALAGCDNHIHRWSANGVTFNRKSSTQLKIENPLFVDETDNWDEVNKMGYYELAASYKAGQRLHLWLSRRREYPYDRSP